MIYNSVVSVYYTEGVTTWKLKEEKQVFKDGRLRTRSVEASVGEKVKPDEDSRVAAYRALQEELGIEEALPLTPLPPIVKGPIPSESFPGLMTVYYMYAFKLWLPTHLYKPGGYVEHQSDKDSYFAWETVSDNT